MIRTPSNLDDHAKAHWKRHYRQCIDNGSLTEETADSFEILCRMWSLIQQTDPHSDSKSTMKFIMGIKWYKDYAIGFGLMHKKGPPPKPPVSLSDIITNMKRTNAEEDEEGEGEESDR